MTSDALRVVIDYRPALRARTGVGEFVHQLAHALRRNFPNDTLILLTSSWKDRPPPDLGRAIPGARVSDHRIPVRLLNFAWHNLQMPPVEWLAREQCDVAFSPHPLLLPSRGAQVVMIHDLDFLKHADRTRREIRRDYPRLAGPHARRAQRVIVPSQYTATEVHRLLNVRRERITVCPHGIPEWPQPRRGFDRSGYLLFVGTLDPRKNVAGLLAAYANLLARSPNLPKLVLAGHAHPETRTALEHAQRSWPGQVEHLGYFPESTRQDLYLGARALVLPSFDEGFGMPVLEAMSLGIPVVASDRGALPELVGDAGLLIDPMSEGALCGALQQVLTDDELAQALADRGRSRASGFSWDRSAEIMRFAFAQAVRQQAASQ